jgi:hypothetical protein
MRAKSVTIIYRSIINNINNQNKTIQNSFKNITNKELNNIIFDLNIIDYYNLNKNWFINYKPFNKITLINIIIKESYQILNYKDLFILINNNKILIIHIYYIFKLKNILISKYELFLKK